MKQKSAFRADGASEMRWRLMQRPSMDLAPSTHLGAAWHAP